MTEYEAALSYAGAWNGLDCSAFLELLAPDCRYASQYVFEELESREQIKEYLIGKMLAVKNTGSKVYAEVGKILSPDPDRFCVLMSQGSESAIAAVILFEVEGEMIQRYDLCMPELFEVERI